MAKFGVGQPMRRSEDPRLLTGGGRYTDDVSLPGQAMAFFLRSPHAHAEIRSIDVAAALSAPGVVGIVTEADLAAEDIGPLPCHVPLRNRDGSAMPMPPRPALARDRVRHVGEPVAVVVAETLDQAKDAAELIDVDYADLPAAVGTAAALEPGTPELWPEAPGNLCFDWEMGDPAAADAAFSRAATVVALDLVNNRVIANPLEGRACLAVHDAGEGRFTLHVGSQGVHDLKGQLAEEIFHLPADRFRVLTGDVGGAFGMKMFMYPEYVVALYAARRFGRPVKWAAERTEGFVSDDHGRDNVSHGVLALDADGRFLALKVDTIANMGAYLSEFGPFIPTKGGNAMLCGLYRFEAVYSRVRGVFTNTQPVDAYRGAGRPEAAYLLERLVDAAARRLGLSPAEIRRRNFIPPDAMPYRTATGLTYDSGDFARNLDDALRLADWDGIGARRREAHARGRLRGIGLATYVEACAGGPRERAKVTVDRAGRVTVLIGTQTNGQGHETAYKQIVAESLGVAPEAIDVIQGDSDRIATGGGTGGSRSIPVGGASIADAALKIQEKAKIRAGELLEAAARDIAFEDGLFTVVGTDRSLSLSAVAARSADETAFDEAGEFKPPRSTYPNGAHVCEVDIDVETGEPQIVRYTVVDDFGTVLNPLLLAGQVHGGVAQGVGQALHERTVFDADGQLLTGSFSDYTMPRADQLPPITFRYNEIPCRTNPLGMKGAGEAGAIGAPPAVINAVVDALAAAGLGVEHVDMPATPEVLWRLIRNAPEPTPV